VVVAPFYFLLDFFSEDSDFSFGFESFDSEEDSDALDELPSSPLLDAEDDPPPLFFA
jgi:hypothetical protein